MIDSEDVMSILYWLIGIVIVIFIIDGVWLSPRRAQKHANDIINRLKRTNKTFYQIIPKYTPTRGIVTIIDDNSLLEGLILLNTLRFNNCQLPILVCYTSNNLSIINKQEIEKIPGVSTLDIQEKTGYENVHDAQLHAYALIYSPFQEVLLIESDILFLGNPEYLFNDPMYTQTGALFWKDRKTQSYWDRKVYNWVRRFIPYRKEDNRILDKQSGSYQSKSIMLINKGNHLKTLEKLWVLVRERINCMQDDKESFWIATELAQEPYSFVPSYPGVIGEVQLNKKLCGHTLYLDPADRLLAWNGSLFNKGDMSDFVHYAIFNEGMIWSGEECVLNAEYIDVPVEIKNLINRYAQIYYEIRNKMVLDDEFKD